MSSARMKRILIADTAILIVCLFGLYRSAHRGTLPMVLRQTDSGVELAAAYGSLAPGALLLRIDGNDIRTRSDVEFYVDQYERGDEVALEFSYANEITRLVVELSPAYSVRYLLVVILCGGLYVLIALIVITRQEENRAARVLHGLFMAIAVMYFLPWGPHGPAIRLLYFLAYTAVPWLFLYLTFLFPREKTTLRKLSLRLSAAVLLVLFVSMSIVYVRAVQVNSLEMYRQYMQIFNIFRFIFSVILLVSAGNFIHSYRTAQTEPERRKLRWVLLGILIGPTALIMLWTLPQVVFGRGLIAEEFVLLIASSIPLTFAVSVIRYHILDIDLIFNRSLVYTGVLAVTLMIYALVVGGVAAVAGTVTVKISLLASAGAAVVIALLFQPLRSQIQHFVDRTFFRIQYNYRETHTRFAEKLKTCLSGPAAGRCLLQQVSEILLPEHIELILLDDEKFRQVEAGRYGRRWHTFYPAIHEQFGEATGLVADSGSLEPGIRHKPVGLPGLREAGLAVICPLRTTGTVLGYLLLGVKKSGLPYFVEDADLLTTTTTETALTIDRLRLQEKWLLEHRAARKLEELNRAQSQFVSSVTHELKTPLTSIKMFAEMLRKEDEVSRQKRLEYLDIMEGEIERLTRLINTVLDFAQIERGTKRYHREPDELNAIVRDVLKTFQYQFKMSNFTVEKRISTQPLPVLADRDALIEALSNLIANAMKYSGDERLLEVSTLQEGEMAVCSVADHGIGIAPEEQEAIFEPFYRSQEVTVQRAGGAGLGLSLVRHVAEAHAGSISVESVPGKGSRFVLRIPVAEEN